MECFLPTEIARLVYGYLIEEDCGEAAQSFLVKSPHLKECYEAAQKGRRFTTRIMGLTLVNFLDVLSEVSCHVQNLVQKKDDSELEESTRELKKILFGHGRLHSPKRAVYVRLTVPEGTVSDDNRQTGEDLSANVRALQVLLENKALHEKIAENINKVVSTSATEEASLEKVLEKKIVETIVDTTEADPVFEQMLNELIGPRDPEPVESEKDQTPSVSENENRDAPRNPPPQASEIIEDLTESLPKFDNTSAEPIPRSTSTPKPVQSTIQPQFTLYPIIDPTAQQGTLINFVQADRLVLTPVPNNRIFSKPIHRHEVVPILPKPPEPSPISLETRIPPVKRTYTPLKPRTAPSQSGGPGIRRIGVRTRGGKQVMGGGRKVIKSYPPEKKVEEKRCPQVIENPDETDVVEVSQPIEKGTEKTTDTEKTIEPTETPAAEVTAPFDKEVTPDQTVSPVKFRKRISLSTPRRGSHVRTLEFETPVKGGARPNRSLTSPKANPKSVLGRKTLQNIRRCGLFQSPPKKKEVKAWDMDLRSFTATEMDIPTSVGLRRKTPSELASKEAKSNSHELSAIAEESVESTPLKDDTQTPQNLEVTPITKIIQEETNCHSLLTPSIGFSAMKPSQVPDSPMVLPATPNSLEKTLIRECEILEKRVLQSHEESPTLNRTEPEAAPNRSEPEVLPPMTSLTDILREGLLPMPRLDLNHPPQAPTPKPRKSRSASESERKTKSRKSDPITQKLINECLEEAKSKLYGTKEKKTTNTKEKKKKNSAKSASKTISPEQNDLLETNQVSDVEKVESEKNDFHPAMRNSADEIPMQQNRVEAESPTLSWKSSSQPSASTQKSSPLSATSAQQPLPPPPSSTQKSSPLSATSAQQPLPPPQSSTQKSSLPPATLTHRPLPLPSASTQKSSQPSNPAQKPPLLSTALTQSTPSTSKPQSSEVDLNTFGHPFTLFVDNQYYTHYLRCSKHMDIFEMRPGEGPPRRKRHRSSSGEESRKKRRSPRRHDRSRDRSRDHRRMFRSRERKRRYSPHRYDRSEENGRRRRRDDERREYRKNRDSDWSRPSKTTVSMVHMDDVEEGELPERPNSDRKYGKRSSDTKSKRASHSATVPDSKDLLRRVGLDHFLSIVHGNEQS